MTHMTLTELDNLLRQDPAYLAAEEELKPFLDVAQDIIALRLAQGWSQSELAQRAGTKQPNISRAESATYNPTIGFLQKLAQALDAELVVRLRSKERPAPLAARPVSQDTQNAILVADWPLHAHPAPYRIADPKEAHDDPSCLDSAVFIFHD
jgi:transcriptional regulator with XRE-family HTH domain